ncbi:OTU domain-containing protein 6B [Nannizzia gypsea CBS 118893]|uniref:OTU domain-containing protein 6B n=1 Tax=Arthroderma gypseum (strain ATCC MYA-4604 / CBS 118893) TaxID=535722 RepID=E5R3A8_ARTGP|nr:OTU domain-containing protein 6B [Nannizzia gypsea CBS 118893]EFQ97923.1 OTU domain-containing protein 6B [Nannizzia gypsea CBS 118893]
MEELQARHRKEQRDLQARITQKKKSATKKTRKGVNDECESLQRQLLEKQQAEISQLNGEVDAGDGDTINQINQLDVKDNDEDEGPEVLHTNEKTVCSVPPVNTSTPVDSTIERAPGPRRGNRQKARLARRAAEREAEINNAANEAANQIDYRANERRAMDEAFARLKLKERDIAPDGHCLYSAVAWQLTENGIYLNPEQSKPMLADSVKTSGYKGVRATTADFILSNANDFAPFLEESIEDYARKIKSTAEWGGQLELQAIARAYKVRINVIQGDGRIEKFQPEDDVNEPKIKDIWLAYYRHTYGLGEHYNALSHVSS